MKSLIVILVVTLLFGSCSTTTFVNKKEIIKILAKDAASWTLDECNQILDFYTAENLANNPFQASPINQKVFIKALCLNKTVIKATARKEVLEKRLAPNDYYVLLKKYFTDLTNLTFDETRNEIIETDSGLRNGYSFKIYFENISDPFEPIFLEDGYSYFFLENMKGDFSRVTGVTGLFVEDYFQLDGYLTAVVKFSPFSTNEKRLFDAVDLNESYKLVFNGLQREPIVIQWNLK